VGFQAFLKTRRLPQRPGSSAGPSGRGSAKHPLRGPGQGRFPADVCKPGCNPARPALEEVASPTVPPCLLVDARVRSRPLALANLRRRAPNLPWPHAPNYTLPMNLQDMVNRIRRLDLLSRGLAKEVTVWKAGSSVSFWQWYRGETLEWFRGHVEAFGDGD
jgi:hypothetical protein